MDAAKAADQIVLALGESRGQSGEAAARSDIDLPGLQQELIDQIAALNKPFVVVLFNGRPLTLSKVAAASPAILEAWFPGTEAGNAVADVLFGKVNPGGKLPATFPRTIGQVPIYYNHEPTGRPCDVKSKYNSRYRDLPACDGLYPFGFGLSYTTFTVDNLRLSTHSVSKNGTVNVSMDVTNTGKSRGDDVAQLYINDPVASISQPVRRLRGFQRVTLDPGQKQTVSFNLDKSDFGFYDNSGRFVVEPGHDRRLRRRQLDRGHEAVVQRARLLALQQGGRSAESHAHQSVDAERHRPAGDDVGHEVLAPVDEGEGHRERVEAEPQPHPAARRPEEEQQHQREGRVQRRHGRHRVDEAAVLVGRLDGLHAEVAPHRRHDAVDVRDEPVVARQPRRLRRIGPVGGEGRRG